VKTDMSDRPVEASSRATPPEIAVAVIEDQPDIREGLGVLIDGSAGYRCTGRYRTMEEAMADLTHRRPRVVLVDLGLPGLSGIEGIRLLKERDPALLLLVLTIHDDDARIFDALCAGASGYLLKNTSPARLIASIQEAVDGGAPMSPEVASRVLLLFRTFRPRGQADQQLTPHELRLLTLLVEGHSYKSAATELSVTVHTISFHLRHIYEKLQVHSKSEAVAKALRSRLIS
jgi:DNA-binding NarL/FixJ family response regulator